MLFCEGLVPSTEALFVDHLSVGIITEGPRIESQNQLDSNLECRQSCFFFIVENQPL